MKILITGGAGFIGANLTFELEKRFPSDSITVLDNPSPGAAENLKGFKGRLIKGSVEDEKLIDSLRGEEFDFIYHLAAITDTTVTDEKRMMGVNVDGFRNILKIAKCGNVPLVYASSAGVYGNGPHPMKETQALHPLNSYALSKAEMEKIALSSAGIAAIGLRYFNVYGPKEANKGKSASMIWQLACEMKRGNPPRIFKYGEQERDFIYVKDVVSATIQAMEVLNRSKLNTLLNIGTGVATNFNRIIEILNNVLGTDFKPDYFDNPYNFYQNHTLADTTLAMKIIGFKAKHSIEDRIKDYIYTPIF